MIKSEQPDFDRSLLTAYVDNELSSEERIAVEKAIQTNPAIKRELAEIRQVQSLVKQAFSDIGQIDVGTLVQSVINESKQSVVPQQRQPVKELHWLTSEKLLAAIAACLMLLVGLPLFLSTSPFLGQKLSKTSIVEPADDPPTGLQGQLPMSIDAKSNDAKSGATKSPRAESIGSTRSLQLTEPLEEVEDTNSKIDSHQSRIAPPSFEDPKARSPKRKPQNINSAEMAAESDAITAKSRDDAKAVGALLSEPAVFYKASIGSELKLQITRDRNGELSQESSDDKALLYLTKNYLIAAMDMVRIETSELTRIRVPCQLDIEMATKLATALLPQILDRTKRFKERPPRLFGRLRSVNENSVRVSVYVEQP